MKEKTLRFAKTIFQTINFKDVIHENPKSSVPHLISHNLIFSGIFPRWNYGLKIYICSFVTSHIETTNYRKKNCKLEFFSYNQMSVKEANEKSSASVEIKCSKFYQMGCNRDLQKLICILAKKLHVKTGMKIIRQV